MIIKRLKSKSYEVYNSNLYFSGCDIDKRHQANLLSTVFQNKFVEQYIPYDMSPNIEDNFQFRMADLDQAIKNSKIKTPGYDGINGNFYKKMKPRTKQWMLTKYNEVLNTGIIPNNWKEVTIQPIKKPGKSANNPHNYRPISLTVDAKNVFEKMLLQHILDICMEKIFFIKTISASFLSKIAIKQYIKFSMTLNVQSCQKKGLHRRF